MCQLCQVSDGWTHCDHSARLAAVVSAQGNDPHDMGVTDSTVDTGETWQRFCRSVENLNQRIMVDGDKDPSGTEQAQGFRYAADLLAAGITVCIEHGDTDHPEFCRMIDHSMKWGLDAPDCLYLLASVNGRHRYRITGHAGSAAHMDVQANWGHFAEGDISKWGTISSIDSTSLIKSADGAVEITLGDGTPGRNHLALDRRAEFVLVRQYFGDWSRERPASLTIERIGQGPAPDAPQITDMQQRYARLCDWLDKSGALWEQMSQGMLAMEPNTVFSNDPQLSSERSGMRGQIYCMGNFACAPDEAVVIEFARPRAKFWTVGLANYYWQSLDYETRQSSLNMTQVQIDDSRHGDVSDDMVRLVIAHGDPGVANWLDPCGRHTGTLIIRCLLADAPISPKLTLVARTGLDELLPQATRRVDKETRAAALRARHAGVLARYTR